MLRSIFKGGRAGNNDRVERSSGGLLPEVVLTCASSQKVVRGTFFEVTCAIPVVPVAYHPRLIHYLWQQVNTITRGPGSSKVLLAARYFWRRKAGKKGVSYVQVACKKDVSIVWHGIGYTHATQASRRCG